MNITVYRGRTFADSTRPLRYIDLDQLAQPVAQITPGSVVSADFTGTAINVKLGYIGGAGIGAQHTLPATVTLPLSVRSVVRFASVPVPGVRIGDIVQLGSLLEKATNEPSPIFNGVITGNVETDNVVSLWATGLGTGSQVLSAGSRINIRVYTF